MQHKAATGGTRAFIIIWVGQLVSLVSSQLTGFALGVWIDDVPHSALPEVSLNG